MRSDDRLPTGRWGRLAISVGGLLMARPALTTATTAVGSVGYYLILVGLLAPAAAGAALQGLGPPFLMPIVGIGLILLAIGNRGNPAMTSFRRATLRSVGVLLMIAFAWGLASQDVSDSVGGYRIFGATGYLGAGVGWAVFGVAASLGRSNRMA